MTEWIGWHFLPDSGVTRWENIKVETGVVYEAKGELKLCENGLHASKRAIDALTYAPGALVSKVRLSGEIIESDDKAVARYREHLAMVDATKLLHLFACDVAQEAVDKYWKGGPEPQNAIDAKRKWFQNKISYEELSAAESAAESVAWSVARSVAWSAAESAAEFAAWSAVWSAVWSATRSAARSATRSAARSAAGSAARSAQNQELEERLENLLE